MYIVDNVRANTPKSETDIERGELDHCMMSTKDDELINILERPEVSRHYLVLGTQEKYQFDIIVAACKIIRNTSTHITTNLIS